MTDRTFTFTIKQIKDIYRAGIRRGTDEQSAYDHGSRPSGYEFDECEETIHAIVNEGKKWEDDDYTDIWTIERWFKEKK